MSGSGGPSNTTSTVTNVTIPEYLKEATLDVVAKAQALADKPYEAYGADRVAGTTGAQTQARQGIMGLQRPEQFGAAEQALTAGTQFQPGEFGMAEAQKYMNPYQQNVIDMAVRQAQREGSRQSAMAGLQAAKFGGTSSSGNAIMQASIARKMPELVGDITAKGMQQAYLNAQDQYQRDRGARQFAADLQQRSGQGLADLGKTIQASDLTRLATMEDVGSREQKQRQLELDIAYQDWMRQSEYDKEMLKFLSDIVGQRSPTLGSTQVAYGPTPSMASQILGSGIAGIGAVNALKGNS